MSNTVRVAAAVEGPTDAIVLEAVLNAIMTNTEFEFQTLRRRNQWHLAPRQAGQELDGAGSIAGAVNQRQKAAVRFPARRCCPIMTS